MHSTNCLTKISQAYQILVLGCLFVVCGAVQSAQAITTEQLAKMEFDLQRASEQLSLLRGQSPQVQVLGVSTTVAAPTLRVPVMPVCKLETDKRVYTLGQPIKISWKATGSVSGEFVRESTEGKGRLMLPNSVVLSKNSATVTASAPGLSLVNLRVKSATGHTFTCTKAVAVISPDTSTTDRRIAPLQARLIQAQKQISTLMTQQEALSRQLAKVQMSAEQLQIQIDALIEPVPSSTVTRVSSAAGPTADASSEFAQARFSITISVTAGDMDIALPKTVLTKAAQNQPGLLVGFVDAKGVDVSANVRSSSMTSSAETDAQNRYIIKEGETETITITAVFAADKNISNNYTYIVKGITVVPVQGGAVIAPKKVFEGIIRGDTGYVLNGTFGFKG